MHLECRSIYSQPGGVRTLGCASAIAADLAIRVLFVSLVSRGPKLEVDWEPGRDSLATLEQYQLAYPEGVAATLGLRDR